MKKFLKKLAAIFVLFLISFASIHADENLKLQNLNDSQKHESSSDDFLAFDSETENFTKDKNGLYNWTGSFVLDTAGLLSKDERITLKKFLRDLNDTTGIQIAVLTVPTTDGENIHDFAVRHFEKWELGQEGVDNGVILTVAFNDHRMDITTGDGAECILTDILCKKILDNVLAPALREGKNGEGIISAVHNMAGFLTQDKSLVTVPAPLMDADGFYEWDDSGIIDAADVITDVTRKSISELLAKVNATNETQIVVLTLPDTGGIDGEPTADVLNRYYKRWRTEHTGLDNGALIVYAQDKLQFSMGVGPNAQNLLTSEMSRQIVDDIFESALNNHEQNWGILKAVEKVAVIITQDESLVPQTKTKEGSNWMVLIPIAGLVLFVFFIWLINKLIDMKEKREREKRRQEEQKAWMALSPEERKRITKEREKQRKAASSYYSSHSHSGSSSSRSSSSSYSSSRSSSSSSHRSGGGGRTSGGGASSSW